ncbi:MAG: inorganic pyrophosphatase [Deltaproteobacteria bacterium]|nr:MAG: inorganic pyrophosphatase [Deltaproteobacteria bacterium]
MSFPPPFYRWRPHPWHGLSPGPEAPEKVQAYIEITPFDLVKYEIEKSTGYLMVDRPVRGSSQPPTLYGFIPQTYSGERVYKLSPKSKRGDGDPIDICVFSERPINRAEVILTARVVGGLQMIDNDEADDKIIAVLQNDPLWGDVNDVADMPSTLVERLQHYFTTYKYTPGQKNTTSIETIYGAEHAHKVVKASMLDYDEVYGR